MTIEAIVVQNNTPQISQKEKQQETVQRVQVEFLNQISKGKDEQTAFQEALKAIDEKYNPQEDEVKLNKAEDVQFENCANSVKNVLHSKAINFKMPSLETIVKWLGYIADVLPMILKIIEKLPTTNAKPEEQANTQQESTSVSEQTTQSDVKQLKLSTTA